MKIHSQHGIDVCQSIQTTNVANETELNKGVKI